MRYESNPKHKQPWQSGRRGSLCPESMDMGTVRELLSGSEAVGDNAMRSTMAGPIVRRSMVAMSGTAIRSAG